MRTDEQPKDGCCHCLLLVGVAVTRTPGQQSERVVGACCLPNGDCALVSNEAECIDVYGGTWSGLPQCVGCPTVPTVVGIAFGNGVAYRVWSDGQVDRIQEIFGCDPAVVCTIVPGTCPTDIDGDGMIGITDFLELLANWGPCP